MKGKHAAGFTPHKKPATILRKIIRIIIAIILLFIAIGIIGNLLPQKKTPPAGSARPVAVADILRNNSPDWYVAAHVVAVVRPDDGGKSVTLVNAGKGIASAVIPLSKLGIATHTVTVWHVWTGAVSPAGALRVVLPAGTAMYLILK